MFTRKDIETKTIFVINCIKEKNLRVHSGELLLEEPEEKKTLTKLPFQKILALFIIGHIHVTTPLIDKCKRFNVALIVVNTNFRPVFYWFNSAEANFLLRQKQHIFDMDDISIAKILISNKIENQLSLLKKTKRRDPLTTNATITCVNALSAIMSTKDYKQLMGMEGICSKHFFEAFFQDLNWNSRKPRIKSDCTNAALDIGYTILFNYMECFLRMYGFDLYIGVFHRNWFKRKSLVCDIMEPFRCIIDRTIRTSFNKKVFSEKDFIITKGTYRLRIDMNSKYSKTFFDALIKYKNEVFKYVQSYYRCFMQNKETSNYPTFHI